MNIDLKKDLKIYKTGDVLEKGDIVMICKVYRDNIPKFFLLNLYTSEALSMEFNSVSDLLNHYNIDSTWVHHDGDKITIKNY